MTTPHPDTPELDKILEKFWADTRYTKEVKRAGNFTETKAALTRLLAKRELEGRIDEVAKAHKPRYKPFNEWCQELTLQ
jgi:hypothetical protein